ncbi:hypothetical protein BpHYR1_008395 [Brachionus plicatilis]|uniref:Uncharacterized protein n=1 Tax=Brachionus plicatilis TaxID=10195 RepID=A0A3M7RWS9_BRAPC|nr:hypothetical protein BpHYR1_008395 [Brachionus plicatilis]
MIRQTNEHIANAFNPSKNSRTVWPLGPTLASMAPKVRLNRTSPKTKQKFILQSLNTTNSLNKLEIRNYGMPKDKNDNVNEITGRTKHIINIIFHFKGNQQMEFLSTIGIKPPGNYLSIICIKTSAINFNFLIAYLSDKTEHIKLKSSSKNIKRRCKQNYL